MRSAILFAHMKRFHHKNRSSYGFIGAILSVAFTAALTGFAVLGMVFVFYASYAVPLFKDMVFESTGCKVRAESMFLNVFTGRCEIMNLTLDNPEAFVAQSKMEDPRELVKFLYAKRLVLKISPFKFACGKFEISEFDAEIETLNCVRFNSASYNLPNFISEISLISSAKGGKLDKFRLKIDRISYHDISDGKDLINWGATADFSYHAEDITDISGMMRDVERTLSNKNFSFIHFFLDK